MKAFFEVIFKQASLGGIIAAITMATSFGLRAQQIYEIEVLAGHRSHSDLPLSLTISALLGNPPLNQMKLIDVTEGRNREHPFQVLETKEGVYVYWVLAGTLHAGSSRTFVFEHGQPAESPLRAPEITGTDLQLNSHTGNLLVGYRHAIQPVPDGVSARYSRAGFIHPINTPSGETLTRIQPPDHYHHYGLWNPWTRIEYLDKTYDLWNLNDNLGTVRFGGFDAIYEGSVLIGFDAIHHHVVFDQVQEDTIINENWRISVFPESNERYLVDIESVLRPTRGDVTLKEYRYGGLGMRAREEWTNRNSTILTSSGKTWEEADGSLEKWVIVSGQLGEGTGGMLFLSHPDNYNFPEPIRVWPPDGNGGRGDQFFNFSPTKNKDWNLTLGQDHALRYRLMVFDGEVSPEEAEQYWNSFANPPQVIVTPL